MRCWWSFAASAAPSGCWLCSMAITGGEFTLLCLLPHHLGSQISLRLFYWGADDDNEDWTTPKIPQVDTRDTRIAHWEWVSCAGEGTHLLDSWIQNTNTQRSKDEATNARRSWSSVPGYLITIIVIVEYNLQSTHNRHILHLISIPVQVLKFICSVWLGVIYLFIWPTFETPYLTWRHSIGGCGGPVAKRECGELIEGAFKFIRLRR